MGNDFFDCNWKLFNAFGHFWTSTGHFLTASGNPGHGSPARSLMSMTRCMVGGGKGAEVEKEQKERNVIS